MAKNCRANLVTIRYFASLFRRADTKFVCVYICERQRAREKMFFSPLKSGRRFFVKENELDRLSGE